jgi:hypothetical protein
VPGCSPEHKGVGPSCRHAFLHAHRHGLESTPISVNADCHFFPRDGHAISHSCKSAFGLMPGLLGTCGCHPCVQTCPRPLCARRQPRTSGGPGCAPPACRCAVRAAAQACTCPRAPRAPLALPALRAWLGRRCTPAAKGLLIGPAAPLAALMDCLRLLAAPMIPCMMLVLGAVLYKGPGSARLPARLVAGVIALRLLLMPLCGARTAGCSLGPHYVLCVAVTCPSLC